MKSLYYQARHWFLLNKLTHRFFEKRMRPFILCYHRIETEEFKAQVRYLAKRFGIVPLDELVQRITHGNFTPCCALTLDDCIREDVMKSLEVVLSEQVPMTYYLPLEYARQEKSMWINIIIEILRQKDRVIFLGKERAAATPAQKRKLKTEIHDYLIIQKLQTGDMEHWVSCWLRENGLDESTIPNHIEVIGFQEVKDFSRMAGIQFESHTSTHPFLYLQTENEIEAEFLNSQKALEEITGQPVTSLCYPYGSNKIIGKEAHAIAPKYYTNATSFVYGICKPGTDNFRLPRIGVYPGDGIEALAGKIYHYQNLNLIRK